jgi:hypothetical protein
MHPTVVKKIHPVTKNTALTNDQKNELVKVPMENLTLIKQKIGSFRALSQAEANNVQVNYYKHYTDFFDHYFKFYYSSLKLFLSNEQQKDLFNGLVKGDCILELNDENFETLTEDSMHIIDPLILRINLLIQDNYKKNTINFPVINTTEITNLTLECLYKIENSKTASSLSSEDLKKIIPEEDIEKLNEITTIMFMDHSKYIEKVTEINELLIQLFNNF